ncbi:MAG: hypothetical protein M3270_01770 [Thermoproteota archaeon]|nr:hypothetical protein [Thermoproteota archaeon]
MNKVNSRSMRFLAMAMGSTLLSTAFFVSMSAIPTEAQYAKDIRGVNERNENGQYVTVSTEHQTSGSHVASFATSNHDINQTKATELRIALRDLWIQHIVWTRLYIVAAAADQPDATFAAERLLKNQEDIGNAIKPFYGDQAGNQLTSQLKDHITIAVDLLKAAKAGDSTALGEIEDRWYANADEIATLLSTANPNWAKEDMLSMLDEHLSLTKTEAVARLTGDYATDVTTFDALYKHAVSMADEFTVGIINQFPERFV